MYQFFKHMISPNLHKPSSAIWWWSMQYLLIFLVGHWLSEMYLMPPLPSITSPRPFLPLHKIVDVVYPFPLIFWSLPLIWGTPYSCCFPIRSYLLHFPVCIAQISRLTKMLWIIIRQFSWQWSDSVIAFVLSLVPDTWQVFAIWYVLGVPSTYRYVTIFLLLATVPLPLHKIVGVVYPFPLMFCSLPVTWGTAYTCCLSIRLCLLYFPVCIVQMTMVKQRYCFCKLHTEWTPGF